MRFTDNQSLDTASMANLDILAGTDVSSGTDKKFTLANLASWFLGQFNGLSLAGRNQTVQAAIDEMSETKADADGAYDDMMVGTAKQLLSDSYTENFEPYKFRRSPYTDRLSESIVGASAAWNQLVQNGNFANQGSNWATGGSSSVASATYTNGICTINKTGSGTYGVLQNDLPIVNEHKYLVSVRLKKETADMSVSLRFNGIDVQSEDVASWQDVTGFIIADSSRAKQFYVRLTTSTTGTCEFTNAQAYDLTQMFGSTVADALYAMGDEGVKLFKSWYPKAYYPYTEPTLEHVSGLEAHDMVGFNQWDEEWELGTLDTGTGAKVVANNVIRSKNYIPVISGAKYFINAQYNRSVCYDSEKNYVSSTPYQLATGGWYLNIPSNAAYILFSMPSAYGTTYNHDICINISDSAKDGTYKPYEKRSYALDASLTLMGLIKYDATKGFYADGDVYRADGTVERRYGIVDLGTLSWALHSSYPSVFYTTVSDKKGGNDNILCSHYINGGLFTNYASLEEMHVYSSNSTTLARIAVKNTSYTDAASFKTAMSGIYMVYELATPTTESAEPYDAIQITDGTEEYVTDCMVPVGHKSKYYQNLRSKIESLPALPTTAGTYRLTVTVSSGKATYTWTAS